MKCAEDRIAPTKILGSMRSHWQILPVTLVGIVTAFFAWMLEGCGATRSGWSHGLNNKNLLGLYCVSRPLRLSNCATVNP
jgi:hypothetical protein